MAKITQIPPNIIAYSEPTVRRSIEDGVKQSIKFSKFHHAITKPEPKDKYVYMPYATTSVGIPVPGYPSTEEYRSEDAAFFSNIGLLANFIPVIGNGISLASQSPDVLYDTSAVIKNPKDWRNYAHLFLDGIQGYVTKTKSLFDDVLNIGGFIDDAAGSQGIDILPEQIPLPFNLHPATVYNTNEATQKKTIIKIKLIKRF